MSVKAGILLLYFSITKICYAAPAGWTDSTGKKPATLQDFEYVFSRILTIAVPFLGIAAFIVLIEGGFKYLTSGGDPKKTAGAQQTITYALVGLILLASVYIIFKLIESFTGVQVTIFNIPK